MSNPEDGTPEQNDDIDSLLGSLDGTDLGGGYDGLGEGNFNSHDAILQEALSDQRVTGSELFDINLAREEAGLNALTPEDILRIEPGLKSVVSEEFYFNNVPTPDIEVEDVDVEGGGEDEDEQLKNRREVDETLAQAEAGDAGDEDKSESNFDFTGQIADMASSLLLENESSRFSDRSVLGEENIVRDMRYPIDALDSDVSKLPAVISFEFFKKSTAGLQELASTVFTADTLGGFASAAVGGVGDAVGGLLGDELQDFSAQNLDIRNQKIIDQNLAQGVYSGVTQEALNQVKDVRINRASERSMDRIFMYVPNTLNFTDTFNYEAQNTGALRMFYEAAAGNSKAVSEPIRTCAQSMISKQAEGFTDDLSGGAVKFNPYDSLRTQIGLVSNPMEEQAFKGVPFRQFSFSFQFAPTSPEEAKMMQNIIQTFRFHSAPELSESTTQFFAPHEVDVKFFRNTMINRENNARQIRDTFGRSARVDEVSTISGGEGDTVGKLVENTEIPKIGRCFVTSVGLNYSPQSKSSFFVNGVPSEVSMQVTMTQAIQINKQFILQGF